MSEQMSALATALALTAKHIEPIEVPVSPKAGIFPMKSAQELRQGNPQSIKVRRNRKRNKLAAKSRKRNNR